VVVVVAVVVVVVVSEMYNVKRRCKSESSYSYGSRSTTALCKST
jgi:hypothetical protein